MYAPRSLHIVSLPTLRAHLARWCPFYYGWVIFAIAASTSYAALPLMSVAVLSVFMVPMTDAFGWSRGLFAGAVSLGGVCAVVISPLVGRLIDRYGSGWMISVISAVAGACAVGLSTVSQTWAFFITLPMQIGGQAVGPVAAGFVFDATSSYQMVFLCLAGVVAFGSVLVLAAIPPSSSDRPMTVEADETP